MTTDNRDSLIEWIRQLPDYAPTTPVPIIINQSEWDYFAKHFGAERMERVFKRIKPIPDMLEPKRT